MLQDRAASNFEFHLDFSQITPATYEQLAEEAGVPLPPPPPDPPNGSPIPVGGPIPGLGKDDSLHYFQLNFTVPDGTWITDVHLEANLGETPGHGDYFNVIGSAVNGRMTSFSGDLPGFMFHNTGPQVINYVLQHVDAGMAQFTVTVAPTDSAISQWKNDVWNVLYNAAQTAFYTDQQSIQAQITAIEDKLANVDTLTLRREENDEIMKCILRWVLGDQAEVFMPSTVRDLFAAQPGADLVHGVGFTGASTNLSISGWSLVDQYEEVVNFVNQAIDWDNVIYFLYSYFWDVPDSWEFIRQIQHPDSTRQAFLRAGSARVVVTVQKGWERAWTYFVLTGSVPPAPAPRGGGVSYAGARTSTRCRSGPSSMRPSNAEAARARHSSSCPGATAGTQSR